MHSGQYQIYHHKYFSLINTLLTSPRLKHIIKTHLRHTQISNIFQDEFLYIDNEYTETSVERIIKPGTHSCSRTGFSSILGVPWWRETDSLLCQSSGVEDWIRKMVSSMCRKPWTKTSPLLTFSSLPFTLSIVVYFIIIDHQ